MGQLLQLLHAATKRANKQQFHAWISGQHPVELADISSSRHFPASGFQSKLKKFNALHDWEHTHLHPCFAQFLGLSQIIGALGHSASPFPLVGLVHISNQITVFTPLQNDDITVTCHVGAIELHPSGVTVEINIDAIQHEHKCLSATSTYLYRITTEESLPDLAPADPISMQLSETNAQIQLDGDAGRNYARISGDYNPIHLYKWCARLLGFKTTIAHGMHVLALALSHLESQYLWLGKPARITNQFNYPAALPCTMSLNVAASLADPERPLSFELHNANAPRRKKVVLAGLIESVKQLPE